MFIFFIRRLEYYIISLLLNPKRNAHRYLSPEPCSPLRLLCSLEGVLLPDTSPCRSTSSDILTLRALSKEVRLEVGRDGPALTVMDGRSGNASEEATRDMLVVKASYVSCMYSMYRCVQGKVGWGN